MTTPDRSKPATTQANYAKTIERLKHIQHQVSEGPRGGTLKGKVCIITGVGSLKGIGRATALLWAREGARHLYLLDYSGENLPNLKDTIVSKYPDVKVTIIQADASDEKAIQDVCNQAINDEGKLDVFFANAGIVNTSLFTNLTAEEVSNMFRVNSLSVFLALKHGSAAMKKISAEKPESGGSIVMTASVAGLGAAAGSSSYSASKAAVISFAQIGAFELAGSNIRVNSISPGVVETGMTGMMFDAARSRGTVGKIGQLNPLGRYSLPEEIANIALFLASANSSYVNGQNIVVDAGLSSANPFVPGKFN